MCVCVCVRACVCGSFLIQIYGHNISCSTTVVLRMRIRCQGTRAWIVALLVGREVRALKGENNPVQSFNMAACRYVNLLVRAVVPFFLGGGGASDRKRADDD